MKKHIVPAIVGTLIGGIVTAVVGKTILEFGTTLLIGVATFATFGLFFEVSKKRNRRWV